MRINFHNYIPFRKKLVANCCIKNKEQSEQCKIYKLDKKTDKKYFSNLSKNKDWNYNHFVDVIDGEFKYGIMPDEFYVLESQDEECLGYSQVSVFEDDYDELFLLETVPAEISGSRTKKRKYIGETLLAFLVKRNFDKGKKKFLIDYPAPSARSFYKEKCGFRQDKNDESLKMTQGASKRFIGKNEKHTGGKIEIIG